MTSLTDATSREILLEFQYSVSPRVEQTVLNLMLLLCYNIELPVLHSSSQ